MNNVNDCHNIIISAATWVSVSWHYYCQLKKHLHDFDVWHMLMIAMMLSSFLAVWHHYQHWNHGITAGVNWNNRAVS